MGTDGCCETNTRAQEREAVNAEVWREVMDTFVLRGRATVIVEPGDDGRPVFSRAEEGRDGR